MFLCICEQVLDIDPQRLTPRFNAHRNQWYLGTYVGIRCLNGGCGPQSFHPLAAGKCHPLPFVMAFPLSAGQGCNKIK